MAYCESCCREQQTCDGCSNLFIKLDAAQRALDELEFVLRTPSDRAAAMDIIEVFTVRSAESMEGREPSTSSPRSSSQLIGGSTMSVSARDRKAVIYGEVERLRHLLDQQEQQLRAQSEELERKDQQLRAQSEELERLRAQSPRPQSPEVSGRRTRIELIRRLAVTCKATVKWVDGVGFQQYVRGEWRPVPAHLIDYASAGLNTETQP